MMRVRVIIGGGGQWVEWLSGGGGWWVGGLEGGQGALALLSP